MSEENAKANLTAEDLFLKELKNETKDLHQKLERSPLSLALMSKDINEADYSLYLTGMRHVLNWYETQIFPAVATVINDLHLRRKLEVIDKDLAALTVKRTGFPGFAAPKTEAQALGFMYVIEGSTLGGTVILKQLLGQPFISEGTTNFLQVYGRNTGPYWRDFIKVLSHFAVENHVENEVIDGAKNAFAQIDRFFTSMKEE